MLISEILRIFQIKCNRFYIKNNQPDFKGPGVDVNIGFVLAMLNLVGVGGLLPFMMSAMSSSLLSLSLVARTLRSGREEVFLGEYVIFLK